MKKNAGRHALSPALVLAGVALWVPSSLLAAPVATSPDKVPSVKLSYAGLDLSSPAGAEILYRRLKVAAQRVCESFDDRPPAQHARWVACVQKALSDAVISVNQPQLTTLYRTHNHAGAPNAADVLRRYSETPTRSD
jgi:UrcA family protein